MNHVLFARVTIFIIWQFQIFGSLLYLEVLSQPWAADTTLSLLGKMLHTFQGEDGCGVLIIQVLL